MNIEQIKTASLEQCMAMVDALADRVAALTGEASKLEDAADELRQAITVQDDERDPPICPACNGSGEGQHDGTRCYSCKGKGTQSTTAA